MPTGYTYPIINNEVKTFPEFIRLCSSAFGAHVLSKDKNLSSPRPSAYTVDDYHLSAQKKEEAELKKLCLMSAKKYNMCAEKEYEKNLNEQVKYDAENALENKKLQLMLDKAKNWTPPTTEHNKLKEFMIEQLNMSINNYESPSPNKITGKQWHNKSITRCKEQIIYHINGYAEEVKRTTQRNKWIKDLEDNLKAITPN